MQDGKCGRSKSKSSFTFNVHLNIGDSWKIWLVLWVLESYGPWTLL